MTSPTAAAAATPPAKIPGQIPYIIGNEGCERFSFYGMRNILTVFLVSTLLLDVPEAERACAAKDVFHTFVIGVYFFPLLGGIYCIMYVVARYRRAVLLSGSNSVAFSKWFTASAY